MVAHDMLAALLPAFLLWINLVGFCCTIMSFRRTACKADKQVLAVLSMLLGFVLIMGSLEPKAPKHAQVSANFTNAGWGTF